MAALHGRTFQVEQGLDLSFHGRQAVAGTTWLTVTSGDLSFTADGTARGSYTQSGNAVTLDLDVLATTNVVRMRTVLSIQFDVTDWDFVRFAPADVELSTMGQ